MMIVEIRKEGRSKMGNGWKKECTEEEEGIVRYEEEGTGGKEWVSTVTMEGRWVNTVQMAGIRNEEERKMG
jgi:hypothetical protein